MAQYPTATIPNGYQIAGGALTDLSKVLDENEERQQKLRLQMQEMAQKRAASIIAQRAAEDKQRSDELEYQQKKDKADRDAKFRKFAEGEDMAPSYDPSQSRTPKRTAAPRSEVDDLEVDAHGRSLPSQSVQGDTSWDMANDAVDNDIANMPKPTKARSPEELLHYALVNGNMDEAKKYADALKALKDKPTDPFNDPALMADFRIRAQDPSFTAIAEGYAKNPGTYGPILQNWAVQNGYSGQKWWAAELGKMYHATPQQQKTPQFNPQTANSQKFTQENAIHDDYTKATGKFDTALPAFAKAQQALQRNNPADAYSAVINFVRTLDPQSTVREAEERLARMSASGGMLSRWFQAIHQNVVGTLDDDVRKNLYESSKGLLQSEFETGYTPARNDARARTLGYPDPTGQASSLDTLNTIGQGREPKFNELMQKDIFAQPAAPAEPAPRRTAPPIAGTAKRKPIDQATAADYLKRAGGDRKKAKVMLAKDGYNVGGKAE